MFAWLVFGWSAFWGNASTAFDLLAGTFGLVRGRKDKKAQTKKEIRDAHLELWTTVRAMPCAPALLDRTRDLSVKPRTSDETYAVSLLLLHFSNAFAQSKAGNYDLPQGLPADIRNFFAYPVRRDAWDELRRYHDRDLVAYVEKARASLL